MKIEDIVTLIEKLEDSSISKLIVETEGSYVEIAKEEKVVVQAAAAAPAAIQAVTAAAPAAAPAAAASTAAPAAVQEDESNIEYITSPIVGTFYEASSPTSAPFVKVGTAVEPGQVVCILEAMKLMNEIESEIKGEIVEIMVKNEEMVEFGQKLFKVRVR